MMKKLLCIALAVLLLCVTACNATPAPESSAPSAPDTTPAQEALTRVLNSEQSFAVKIWSTGREEQKKLSDFTFGTEYAALNVFVPAQYSSVDMDGDGVRELVVLSAKMDFFLVLRYNGGQVTGYMVPYRGLMQLRTDGRFWSSGGAALSVIGRMSFDGPDYTVTELAYRDQYDGVYRLDGVASDKESVEAYYTAWESVPEVEWTPFAS